MSLLGDKTKGFKRMTTDESRSTFRVLDAVREKLKSRSSEFDADSIAAIRLAREWLSRIDGDAVVSPGEELCRSDCQLIERVAKLSPIPPNNLEQKVRDLLVTLGSSYEKNQARATSALVAMVKAGYLDQQPGECNESKSA